MTEKSPSLARQLSVPSETCYPDEELERAEIPKLQVQTYPGQFGTASIGHLGRFVFIRNGRYWMVNGLVPLDVAEELYRHKIGHTDVRVVDLTWHPVSPITVAKYYDSDGKPLVSTIDGEHFRPLIGRNNDPPHDMWTVANPVADGQLCVDHFFITSEQGLQLFVNTLRQHNLV